MTTPSLPDDDDVLAAELAFGLLDPVERAAAEARIEADAGFATLHRRWQARAATMLEGADEQPRPSVWTAITARIAANDDRSTVTPPSTQLRFWRMATAASVAAALVLALTTLHRTRPAPVVMRVPAPVEAPLVAVLAAKGRMVVTVSFDRASLRLVTAPAGLAVEGRSAQLWVIPADGTPRSLGLVASAAPRAMPAPEAAAGLIGKGATLAISLEPQGGSPTGLPTGPVILTGKVVSL